MTPRSELRVQAMIDALRRYRFIAFCLAGGLGFVADVTTLALVRDLAGLYLGRLLSFAVAVTVTWAVNRNLAFHDRRSTRLIQEWGRYVSANTLGACVNYGTYAVLVTSLTLCATYPSLAVAAGSIAGLVVNFSLSHRLVFQR